MRHCYILNLVTKLKKQETMRFELKDNPPILLQRPGTDAVLGDYYDLQFIN
jgi:hypothetical protein